MHHTCSKGDIGVARAIADLTERGYDVLLPVNSTSPFDLVIHQKGSFWRVQVKYVTAVKGTFTVLSYRKSIWNGKVKKSRNTEIDLICAFNPDTDKCHYLKPCDTPRCLRIVPAKSAYKSVHMAANYEHVPDLAVP